MTRVLLLSNLSYSILFRAPVGVVGVKATVFGSGETIAMAEFSFDDKGRVIGGELRDADGREFEIESCCGGDNGAAVLAEIDTTEEKTDTVVTNDNNGPAVPPSSSDRIAVGLQDLLARGKMDRATVVHISIMIYYTVGFASSIGGPRHADGFFAEHIAKANAAMAGSGIPVKVFMHCSKMLPDFTNSHFSKNGMLKLTHLNGNSK